MGMPDIMPGSIFGSACAIGMPKPPAWCCKPIISAMDGAIPCSPRCAMSCDRMRAGLAGADVALVAARVLPAVAAASPPSSAAGVASAPPAVTCTALG